MAMKQVTAERLTNVIGVLLQKPDADFDHHAYAEVAGSSLKSAASVCGPLAKKGVLKKIEYEDGSVGYERGPKFKVELAAASARLARAKNAPPCRAKVEEQLPSPSDLAQTAHTEMIAIYFIRAIRAAGGQMSTKLRKYFDDVIANMPS